MKDSVKSYIKHNGMIARGDTVWVALSGGADSCCLLHILNDMSDELGITLNEIHFNHELRGNESDSDEQFCRDVCSGYNIELEVYRKDIKKISSDKGMTIEQAGRSARYEIFEKRCTGKVAIAHNMNDNAETLLMNLIRGAGATGLSGISAVNGKYIRPLLKTTRADIEQYCRINNVKYITDKSNADTVYFRNAVRHDLLPVMNDIAGKDIVSILDRASEKMALDNNFINNKADEAYKKITSTEDGSVSIDNLAAINLHPALLSRVLRRSIEEIKGNLTDIESRHIALLTNMIKTNGTGSAVNLPDGVTATVQFGKTIIREDKESLIFEYFLPIPGKIFIKERGIHVTTRICKDAEETTPSGDVHYFSLNSCKDRFTVRNRRNGDIIRPWKGRGTAKLKKYFIDKKVVRHTRNSLMLIACNENIAYIEGMEYGKNFLPVAGESVVEVVIERR